MFKRALWIGLTLSVFGLVSASGARADEWDKKTILTFSQPFELPGHVLPAGTYMFKLNDSMSDRHIVQVFNADGTKIFATIMAIPNYRLKTTDGTTIKFREMPAGQPEAIRAWFYPGNSVGQEFVYPKHRAMLLAKATKAPVPALAVETEVATVEELKTVPIVAVTPEEQEVPVADVIQTTPIAEVAIAPSDRELLKTASPMPGDRNLSKTASPLPSDRELPKTASSLPLIAGLGLGSLALAFALMMIGKRATA